MSIDAGVASSIVISCGSLVAVVLTNRNNRRSKASSDIIEGQRIDRAADTEDRRVSRDEFDSLTRELRTSLDDVREELATERSLRQRATEGLQQANRRIRQLERVMREHSVPVPASD